MANLITYTNGVKVSSDYVEGVEHTYVSNGTRFIRVGNIVIAHSIAWSNLPIDLPDGFKSDSVYYDVAIKSTAGVFSFSPVQVTNNQIKDFYSESVDNLFITTIYTTSDDMPS